MMIDRLEPRLQYASISGLVFNDTDSSKAFDNNDTSKAGTTVFIDANANGAFDAGERSTTANGKGVYTFTGLAEGDYVLGTTVDPAVQLSTTATTNGTSQGRFNIELRGLDGVTPVVKNALISAAQRWMSVVVGDDPDVPQSGGSVVDDLIIDVRFGAIDRAGDVLGTNVLATGTPTGVRVDDGSYHAYRGLIRVDSFDAPSLAASGQLYDTVLHEMGHVLGFGTNWNALGLVSGRNSRNPRFIGANATREFNRLFKTVNVSVPIENTGARGTRGVHWSENVLKEELMTSAAGATVIGADGFSQIITEEPLSVVTVGALDDEGYEVNYDAADKWDPVGHNVTFNTAKDNLGGVANERKITVGIADAVTGLDFGFRDISRPVIRSFNISPSPVSVNRTITLTAASVYSPDDNAISGVTFYRESNGIEGLQKDTDTPIGHRDGPRLGQYAMKTSTAGLSGDTTYYAVVTDSTGLSGRRNGTVNVITTDPPESQPGQLAVRQRSSTAVRFAFTFPEGTATGYRIQLATNRTFGTPSLVQAYNISADTTSVNVVNLNAGTTYYIRVRAFNDGGVGGYSSALAFELA